MIGDARRHHLNTLFMAVIFFALQSTAPTPLIGDDASSRKTERSDELKSHQGLTTAEKKIKKKERKFRKIKEKDGLVFIKNCEFWTNEEKKKKYCGKIKHDCEFIEDGRICFSNSYKCDGSLDANQCWVTRDESTSGSCSFTLPSSLASRQDRTLPRLKCLENFGVYATNCEIWSKDGIKFCGKKTICNHIDETSCYFGSIPCLDEKNDECLAWKPETVLAR